MSEPNPTKDLLRRWKQGDQQAGEEFVREYWPEIRRAARRELSSDLRREVDSADIFQSVLKDLWARPSAGDAQFENAGKLLAFLVTTVKNKVTDKARARDAEKRPQFVEVSPEDVPTPVDRQTASQIVAAAEQQQEIRRSLTDQEWAICQGKANDDSWEEIGKAAGLSAEAARKRWAGIMESLKIRLTGH